MGGILQKFQDIEGQSTVYFAYKYREIRARKKDNQHLNNKNQSLSVKTDINQRSFDLKSLQNQQQSSYLVCKSHSAFNKTGETQVSISNPAQ